MLLRTGRKNDAAHIAAAVAAMIVVREGRVALHYSVHFFSIFFFHATIVIEGEGIGSRSVRFPHLFCVCPTRSRKQECELRAMCMDTAGSPTQPYKILYG